MGVPPSACALAATAATPPPCAPCVAAGALCFRATAAAAAARVAALPTLASLGDPHVVGLPVVRLGGRGVLGAGDGDGNSDDDAGFLHPVGRDDNMDAADDDDDSETAFVFDGEQTTLPADSAAGPNAAISAAADASSAAAAVTTASHPPPSRPRVPVKHAAKLARRGRAFLELLAEHFSASPGAVRWARSNDVDGAGGDGGTTATDVRWGNDAAEDAWIDVLHDRGCFLEDLNARHQE
ncbi:hypothetical protein HK405_008175 [Cladochytrium tenue]|nr:hypothetical protein HK405_008175 [Cladochytrium tenue]